MEREEEELGQGSTEIMELEEVSLFEDDPYSEQASELELSEQPSEPFNQQMHLFNGEVLLHQKVFRVEVECDSKLITGQYEASTSNYRALFFRVKRPGHHQNGSVTKKETPISIPFSMMDDIDIIKSQMILKLKTGLSMRVKSCVANTEELYRHYLKGYMGIPFFPLYVFPQEEAISYDCLVEMQRMRMNWSYLIIVKNAGGELCPSYPKYFIVPKRVESNLLEECLKIRNNCRIPVVTYYWPDCKAALWRASGLKVSQGNNKFNQAYMKEICRQPFVLDLKEDTPLRGNFLTRNSDAETVFKFMPLTNLNSFFKKLCISYAKDEREVLLILQRWYDDINTLLKCAYLAVDHLKRGRQVVVVEQSGVDRACQVSALAQIIIEPYYRTITGFSILIEKEFVSFGHPFNHRLGFEREKLNEESPVFVQFLECVHHLITAHPRCFQFSSFYLARVGYEAFTAKYNNFFFNDEFSKKKEEFLLKTQNIWKHLPMEKEFYNYQWCEREAVRPLMVLRTCPSVKEFMVWREFYDLVSQMRAEHATEIHVKRRRSSLYKILNRIK